ncbi:MAG: sensor histidine kinase [Verrucomicrobiaceae bacterium]|nr:sensor histidine kinase [Verrucomicrobiaceae bacterium]
MNTLEVASRIGPKTIVRVLTVGFGLVLILLVLAGSVAFWEANEMQQRAASIQEQQKLMDHSRELALESIFIIGVCLLVAAACALGTIQFVKHTVRRIEAHQDELNRVSWHMLQTQEETARRFSHELHDELGQSLAAVRSNLTKENLTDIESLRHDTLSLVDGAIANVRELSQLLRPVILDDFGLDAGLRWLTDGFAQRTRIDVSYSSSVNGRFDEEIETHLFRIAQEALTNVARHANASRVDVKLRSSDGNLTLTISDNGKGLPQNTEKPPTLGMVGMRARARHCGGELNLAENQPKGLQISATVPLNKS